MPQGEAKSGPPAGNSTKRKRDDTNGQAQHPDRSRDEEYKSRSISGHGSNGKNQASEYEGSKKYQGGSNQSYGPGTRRRKRRRRQYENCYGDYYDGHSDDYDDCDDYDDYR
ncbi:hypothetical protein FRC11_006073 [Ceratobasidium sp. 423]|nr:hypothetical protein FRC11_006073 [Ceratobasidium sp. 423]